MKSKFKMPKMSRLILLNNLKMRYKFNNLNYLIYQKRNLTVLTLVGRNLLQFNFSLRQNILSLKVRLELIQKCLGWVNKILKYKLQKGKRFRFKSLVQIR